MPPNSKKDIVVKHKLPANINANHLGGVVNFIIKRYGFRKICQESTNSGKMKKRAYIAPLTSKKTKTSESVYGQTIYISK